MRSVSIRRFRANMAVELANLPFELTKNGAVIAVVGVYTKRVVGAPKRENVYTTEPNSGPGRVHNEFFNPMPKSRQLGKR